MVTGVPCESVPLTIRTLSPFEAVVARDDVTGQVRAGDVADVDLGIGVGPGNGDQDVFRHSCLQLDVCHCEER